MNIRNIQLITLLLAVIIMIFSFPLGLLLLFIPFFITYPKLLNLLSEYTYGVNINLPIFEECDDQAAYIRWENRGKRRRVKVGTALKIIDINNNIYDLDAYEWISKSKAFLDDSITDYDVEYKLIYVKYNNDAKYMIGIAASSTDMQIARNRLFDNLIRIKRNLENLGIETKIVNKDDLVLPLKLVEARTKRWIIILLFLLTIALISKIGLGSINSYLIAGFPFSLLIGLVVKGLNSNKSYRLLNSIIVVKEDKAAYREISVEELYKNAINLHNNLNRNLDNYIIVVSISRLSSNEVEDIRAKFYRMVKWGEAMGRYEMIDEADKYDGLVNRGKRGEMLYRCKTIVYVDDVRTARYLSAILENIGLKVFTPLIKGDYLDNIY